MARFSSVVDGHRKLAAIADVAAGKAGELLSDNRGSVAAIAALAFPVLIGGLGLGAEVGYWYLKQRELQHAADVSAFAAAVRLNEGDSKDKLDEIALHIATESGFSEADGTINVYNPPISGPNAGDEDMVEVVLNEDVDRVFSRFFKQDDVSLNGRAVARIISTPDPACLIALAGSGDQTLSMTGNGSVTLNSCVAVANSSGSQGIYVKGSGTLTAKCTYSQSGSSYAQKTNSIVTECNPEVQKDTTEDPYKAVTPPTKAINCYTPAKKGLAIPVLPSRVVAVPGGGTLNVWDLCALHIDSSLVLLPGLYIIYGGDITDSGQNTVTGVNVTFYLTSKASAPTDHARINVNGTKFNLKAPTSGPYSGLVFFSSVENTGTQSFGGNSNLQAQGALRFPGGTIDFGGGSGSGGCVQLVSNKITFTGNGDITFGHNCAGAGTTTANAGSSGSVKIYE